MKLMTLEQQAPLATVFEVMNLVARCYPPALQATVEAELPGLQFQALRLALEVVNAEGEGIPFADAVQRPMSFPLMTKLNHGAIAMLQFEVPEEALDYIRDLFARLVHEDVGDLRQAVLGATASRTPEGALLRFLLYQAARIDRWLRVWRQPAFEATGALQQIDREAQLSLEFWLKLSPNLPSDVSPLRLADAESMFLLKALAERKLDELRTMQADAMEEFQAILQAASLARELSFEDSVVLRNEYQSHIGAHRLASAELAEIYPSSFPSPNAVDQRAHRVRSKMQSNDAPSGEIGPRLLDLMQIISEQIDKESA
jgi:hypothetical protein